MNQSAKKYLFQRRVVLPRYPRSSREVVERLILLSRRSFWRWDDWDPQIADRILQIWVTTEHMPKFNDDLPRNPEDQTHFTENTLFV